MRASLGLAFASLVWLGASEKLSLQVGLGSIQDLLQDVELAGKGQSAGEAAGRKMFLEHLMKTAAKLPAGQPAWNHLNETVFPLFQEILDKLMTTRDNVQVSLTAVIDPVTGVASCTNQTAKDKADAAKGEADAQQGSHKTCRDVERGLANTDFTDCGQFKNFVDDTFKGNVGHDSFDVCLDLAPIITSGDRKHYLSVGTWTTYFANGKTHFDSQLVTWNSKKDACTASHPPRVTKRGECDTLQTGFQEKYCIYATELKTRCEYDLACYNAKNATHHALWAVIEPQSDRRVNDARMLNFTKCLVRQLLDNENIADIDAWKLMCDPVRTYAHTEYANQYVPVPDPNPCDQSDLDVYLNDNFVLDKYGDIEHAAASGWKIKLLPAQACPGI